MGFRFEPFFTGRFADLAFDGLALELVFLEVFLVAIVVLK
jgi:hypothetical protein